MSESGVHAEFYLQPILHPAQSRQEGRQVFVDKTFIKITIAGSKDIVMRPANEQDYERFPAEWAAWQNKQVTPLTGTPVCEWPAITPAQVRNLETLHIRTVEDMAAASDMALQKIGMGARDIQEKARRFLAGNTKANELEATVQTQQKTIAAQAGMLARLESRIAAFETSHRDGPEPKAGQKPLGLAKKPEASVQ